MVCERSRDRAALGGPLSPCGSRRFLEQQSTELRSANGTTTSASGSGTRFPPEPMRSRSRRARTKRPGLPMMTSPNREGEIDFRAPRWCHRRRCQRLGLAIIMPVHVGNLGSTSLSSGGCRFHGLDCDSHDPIRRRPQQEPGELPTLQLPGARRPRLSRSRGEPSKPHQRLRQAV